jgi:ubiquinone/menaquinone biosynthesis C-methylase UbiE
MQNSPDYRYDPIAYELEEMSRPDEMAMLDRLGMECNTVLDNMADAQVLDLCCGTGLSLQYIVNHVNAKKVVGVDNCVEYLEFAKSKFQGHPNIELVLHDAVTVNLPIKQWDLIIMASAYHHIRDVEKSIFLKKVHHLLSDRGIVILAENILPEYELNNTRSYENSVSVFYKEVLKTAHEENPDLPEYVKDLIWKVAEYGFAGDYEYKTSYSVLKNYLFECELRIMAENRVWPLAGPLSFTTGGNYVMKIKKNHEKI